MAGRMKVSLGTSVQPSVWADYLPVKTMLSILALAVVMAEAQVTLTRHVQSAHAPTQFIRPHLTHPVTSVWGKKQMGNQPPSFRNGIVWERFLTVHRNRIKAPIRIRAALREIHLWNA